MMRISALYYFFLLCCALFVLMTCGVDEKDLDAENPTSVPEFSEESNKIYNALPEDLQLTYFKQKSKAAKELDTAKQEEKDAIALKTFLMFKCATSNMKSDCEEFYPKFVGEGGKSQNANVREFVKSFMRDIKTDFNITIELGDMINNFSLTDAYYGVDERFQAKTKMTT